MGKPAAQENAREPARTVERDEIGFAIERTPVATFHKVHQHSEVEIAVLEGGAMRVLFGETHRVRKSNQLSIFWAAMPHGDITVLTGSPVGYSLTVPLALFVSWQLPSALGTAVLHGRFLEDEPHTEPCSDLALLKHWHKLMQEADPEANNIVMHEVQARLRRFARGNSLALNEKQVTKESSVNRATELFERMLVEIHSRHQEPLAVREIAKAAEIGSDHAMHVFREVCGISIHEYVTRCRIFTAQRLLATTSDKVSAIGHASGFRSSDCFHDAFKKICGRTPRQYRDQIRGKN